MKAFWIISLMAISFSTFAKSSNQKIAYCEFSQLSGGAMKVHRFIDQKYEQKINLFHSIGSIRLEAEARVEPGKSKQNKSTSFRLSIEDSESKASVSADGLSTPGQEMVLSLRHGGDVYNAICGLIDDKFLEENLEGNMTHRLIKRELEKNN